MDYRHIVQAHRASRADVTVSCTLVPERETKGLGLLKVNSSGRVTNFIEKPKTQSATQKFRLDRKALQSLTQKKVKSPAYLASMGVYVFRASVLAKLLKGKEADFGKEIIPKAIFTTRAYAYLFEGFWRDIGTIDSFYDVNIGLATGNIAFDFFSKKGKFFTHPRFLPPLKVQSARIHRSLLSEGCILNEAEISDSVVGLRSLVGKGTHIERSYIMGADFYEKAEKPILGQVPVGIGKNCVIKNAILDKNVRIGDRVKIINRKNLKEADGSNFCIRDGIVIIPKGAVVASGTVI
jgi:glucose-1-phosphate adenylyltransferase